MRALLFVGTHNSWVLKVCDETKLQVDGKENQNTCILCISCRLFSIYTRKFPKFQDARKFCCYLDEKKFYHRIMHPKYSDSIANSEGPDQTAPLGVVRSGSAQTYLS